MISHESSLASCKSKYSFYPGFQPHVSLQLSANERFALHYHYTKRATARFISWPSVSVENVSYVL
jgi:hypothetical protein